MDIPVGRIGYQPLTWTDPLLGRVSSAEFGERWITDCLATLRGRPHAAGAVRASAPGAAWSRRNAGSPKSAAGVRNVALPTVLVDELRRHIERYAGSRAEGLVFLGEKGGMLRRATSGGARNGRRSS